MCVSAVAVGLKLPWGWLGCKGRERGEAKNMLFGEAGGIRSLFQGHSPGGVMVVILVHKTSHSSKRMYVMSNYS